MPVAYETELGRCHLADAREVLAELSDDSIDLVLTSPPYALRRKKRYGNADAAAYREWFLPFAAEIY
ncbi:MAG: site-specific DNA-methyltransferase, partial [Gemmataceae bacterium]